MNTQTRPMQPNTNQLHPTESTPEIQNRLCVLKCLESVYRLLIGSTPSHTDMRTKERSARQNEPEPQLSRCCSFPEVLFVKNELWLVSGSCVSLCLCQWLSESSMAFIRKKERSKERYLCHSCVRLARCVYTCVTTPARCITCVQAERGSVWLCVLTHRAIMSLTDLTSENRNSSLAWQELVTVLVMLPEVVWEKQSVT